MADHIFKPQRYYSTIGSHEPVLNINPGDRVITTTVDAHGQDEYGVKITPPGPNPMTGPFYVSGAEPGDTLVVRLEKIQPNRQEGWSAQSLAPGVVEADFVPQLDPRTADDPRQFALWDLDPRAGTATLRSSQTNLRPITLPLAPMLGCFGVAPAFGQAVWTATSGEHGGNMDYRGFKAGATVYLPVFAPGALFFLGDGHAIQGHGEIAGTGIEVSMDVQFQVELQKGQLISLPRGEDELYIFTIGNARPLDLALQLATTEMMRWLTSTYHLDIMAAGLLLGQVVEYEVGNVFDPAYTMVCKLPKKVLLNL